MFSHPDLSVFRRADVSLFSDVSNRTSRLLNTWDFDEKTLQAIDAWTDMQRASSKEQAPTDAVDGCYPKSNDESDESSFRLVMMMTILIITENLLRRAQGRGGQMKNNMMTISLKMMRRKGTGPTSVPQPKEREGGV
jgi:hypothetical protein